MGNQAIRQLHIQHHEKNWPVDGVETKNVFSNHVEDRSIPELVVVSMIVLTVTKSSRIVKKGINPNVDNVFWIGRDWHTPGKDCTRNR